MPKLVRSIQDFDDLSKVLSNYIQSTDKLALLLDYDGTLAPINRDSNQTIMNSYSEGFLKKLSVNPNILVAIISGRGVNDVKRIVGIDACTYAGNHGMEIIFPNGGTWEYGLSNQIKENFLKMVEAMEAKLTVHGAFVENKTLSVSYHYNEVPEEYHEMLTAEAKRVIESFGFLCRQAKLVIEARPPVDWNKGKAAVYILQKEFGDDWRSNVKVIFAGDDNTDEDAMQSLKTHAISFRISDLSEVKTFADYRLPSTIAVSYLLSWLENKL